ncbi:MAG: hypothetical protein FD130_642, partial [Halothiobacillaceae bacterium]
TEYVAQDPDHPSALLVDVIEEEFRIESVAHVNGADRTKLLARKATALFRGATFTSAQVIGRERTGRRDDQVLFSALNRVEPLERWLKAIQSANVPLAGVYSAPMMAGVLINKLNIKESNALVLTLHHGRLLRQSFFSHGKLKLSRLSSASLSNPQWLAKNVQSEIDRMRRYLERLQLVNITDPMHIYLLCEEQPLMLLRAHCHNEEPLNYHFLALHDVAAKVALKQPLSMGEGEWLFAALLSQQRPLGNYIASRGRLNYNLYYLRRALIAASLALVSATAVWSATDIYAGATLARQALQIAASTQQVILERAQEEAKRPTTLYSPRTMRAVVDTDQQLREHKPNALKILSPIGASLLEHPNRDGRRCLGYISDHNRPSKTISR